MRISPVSSIAAAIQTQALAAVEGALVAGLTDNASIVAAVDGAEAHGDPPHPGPQPPPSDPARAAVDQARASAAASQSGLALMFADLAAALNARTTPPQLRTALANVLALRTPIGADFTGPQLHRAVSQSGLLLEAKLAAGAAPGRDLKASLLTLLRGLRNLPPPPVTTEMVQPLAEHAGSQPEIRKQQFDQIRLRPPPPFREAALTAQRPEVSSLPAAHQSEVALRLTADVEQAVARQVLHQIASLPQGHDGPAWMFELPFLTPQGAMLAQFAIQRDEQGRGAAPQGGPTWRARFAMEVDPIGPVHVDLHMSGAGRSHVTIWAGEEGLARLAPDTDLLGRTLDADVALRPGAPAEAAPAAPGQFVDRTS
jgi:hypothetical protein